MTFLLCLACRTLAWADPPDQARPGAPPVSAMDIVSALETVVADAIARAEPSVVAIHRIKNEHSQETLAVRGRSRPSPGPDSPLPRSRISREIDDEGISFDFGSGVVVGTEGQILTAFHVVRGAARLEVRAAGRQRFEAEILAADPRSDLAVIAPMVIPGAPAPQLLPMALGDSGRLRKGSFLIAMGNPFNAAQDGKPAASLGILSNIARSVPVDVDEHGSILRAPQLPNYPTLLQLDSKLNLGMSGGAVVNMKGELVGLTTMAASPSGFDAMAGYAMPMDRIGRRAVETLRQGKEIEYGLLGVRNLERSTNRVEQVTPNSPAAQGDLQANDEVLAANDIPVSDFDTLVLALHTFAPGDEVRLRIRRNSQELVKRVVLAKYPVDGEMIATNRPAPWRGIRVDYLSTMATRPAGLAFGDSLPGGVAVTEVIENSPADKAGLKKFQVIRQVEKTNVANPREFAKAAADHKGPVTLLTESGLVTVAE